MKEVILNRIRNEIKNAGNPISAKELINITNFAPATVYKAIKILLDNGEIEEGLEGRSSVYSYVASGGRTSPVTPITDNSQNTQNVCNTATAQKETTQHITVNGNGIKVVKYDPQKLVLNRDEVLSKYERRKINGIEEFAIFDFALQHQKNVLLIGEKGCGKSAMARAFSAYKELPYFRINLDGMITSEDLLGQWVRAGNDWAWSDGVLTMAMRHGGVLVIDEINAGSPEVNFVFQSALDDDRQIILRNKDNEVVKAHENFLVIATMNPDYEGTHPLNEALEDRFDIVLEVGYDEKIEERIIKDKNLRELAKRIRKMHRKGEVSKTISTRTLVQFQDNMEIFGTDFAIQAILGKFEKEDRQAIEEAAKQTLSMDMEKEATVETTEEGGETA